MSEASRESNGLKSDGPDVQSVSDIAGATFSKQPEEGSRTADARLNLSYQSGHSWQNSIHALARVITARWEDAGHVQEHQEKHSNLIEGARWNSIIDHELALPDGKTLEARDITYGQFGGILTANIKVHSADRQHTLEVQAERGIVSVTLDGNDVMDFDGTPQTASTCRALNKISALYLESDLASVPKTEEERLIRDLDAIGALLQPERSDGGIELRAASLSVEARKEEGTYSAEARKRVEDGITHSWISKANDVLYAVLARSKDAGEVTRHTFEKHPGLIEGAQWDSVPDHTVQLPGGLTLEATNFSFTNLGGCIGGELTVYGDDKKEALRVSANQHGVVDVYLGDRAAMDYDGEPICKASSRVIAKIGSAYLDAALSKAPAKPSTEQELRDQLDAF